jgi:hypothetical protein
MKRAVTQPTGMFELIASLPDKLTECVAKSNNKEWIKIAKKLYEIKKVMKEYEKIEKELSKELKILSDHRSAMGGHYIYEATTRQGNVDYAAIPELAKINLEKYRKEDTIVWKLFKLGEK